MNAVNLQTIVESLDREKTILVFSKQSQTFHTFGKGEKLNSNIYESKKDQVELKIHEFITDNRYYLNDENLNKLQLNLENRIKHLDEKIYGIKDNTFQRLMKCVKKCINVFKSIFPFTSEPRNGMKEREESDA